MTVGDSLILVQPGMQLPSHLVLREARANRRIYFGSIWLFVPVMVSGSRSEIRCWIVDYRHLRLEFIVISLLEEAERCQVLERFTEFDLLNRSGFGIRSSRERILPLRSSHNPFGTTSLGCVDLRGLYN